MRCRKQAIVAFHLCRMLLPRCRKFLLHPCRRVLVHDTALPDVLQDLAQEGIFPLECRNALLQYGSLVRHVCGRCNTMRQWCGRGRGLRRRSLLHGLPPLRHLRRGCGMQRKARPQEFGRIDAVILRQAQAPSLDRTLQRGAVDATGPGRLRDGQFGHTYASGGSSPCAPAAQS